MTATGDCNVLTVDVEDWYHDGEGGLGGRTHERRVERNLMRLLDLFDGSGARATLFFLGEVAVAHPALVRETLRRGHELGSHGYSHRRLPEMLRRELREDLRRSFGEISSLAGKPIAGYRAPYFSIKAGVRWPLEAVAAAGFRFDSSVLPIDRPPGLEVVSPRVPYRIAEGLWEVPIAVNRYWVWNLPMLGGFALRTLSLGFLRRRLREFNREFGPAVIHIHPWELDEAGPEPAGVSRAISGLKRWGRGGLENKLRDLLSSGRFVAIGQAFPEVLG